MVEAADHTNQPIWPQFKSPSEWPWTICLMVSETRRILSYLKNLTEDQQPPKSIWHSQKKCADFIERAMKVNTKGTGASQFLEFADKELEHADR